MSDRLRPEDTVPVYAISVAAQISGLHPQTLRQYDRLGLVSPDRTSGRNRLYSLRDIERLREVSLLTSEGVNLAGIQRIMRMESDLELLRSEAAMLRAELMRLRPRLASAARTGEGSVSDLPGSAVVVWRPRPADRDR
jgi:MerR family transcriptional regulator/heat shock protein HspR